MHRRENIFNNNKKKLIYAMRISTHCTLKKILGENWQQRIQIVKECLQGIMSK